MEYRKRYEGAKGNLLEYISS